MLRPLEHADDHGYLYPTSMSMAKPIIHFDDYSEYDSDEASSCSQRYRAPAPWGLGQRHDRNQSAPDLRWSPSPEPEHRFFIIREGTPPAPPEHNREVHLQPNHTHRQHQSLPLHHENAAAASIAPAPVACLMARTDSGRMIMTETDLQPSLECPGFSPQQDREAALRVKQHMARPRPHVKRHERILRALIHPRAHADKATDFPLDHAALESIFSAADEIFFQGRLSCRVHWEWSSGCVSMLSTAGGGGGSLKLQGHGGQQGGRIIGTTALRRASPPERGGYETLIVLSSPILKDTSYNRRLLISTFLHELIHSYLFICCGFKARHCGGHTDGFKDIAATIDQWAGRGTLRLCDMEADLEHFREDPSPRTPSPMSPVSPRSPRSPSPVADEYYHQHQHQHQHQHHHQHDHYQHHQHHDRGHDQYHQHHHGGVDFYDLNAGPWSTGPRVVFGGTEAHTAQGAADGSWDRCGPTPMSMPTPMVDVGVGGWGGYESPEAVSWIQDVRDHTLQGR